MLIALRILSNHFILLGNKGFYNPNAMKNLVSERFAGDMKYSTVPDLSQPNVKLAGKRYELKAGQTQKARDIVFDHKGYPIFDKYTTYDMKLPKEISSIKKRETHMRAATRDLRAQIDAGKIDKSQFTSEQLQDISAGKPKIKDLTWHHHQDIGRMQLIPSDIHKAVRHVGGIEIWN